MAEPKSDSDILSKDDEKVIYDNEILVVDSAASQQHDAEVEEVFGDDRKRLSKSLKQRHLQMMALVGTIGTGIFLSSGGVLAVGGPLGCFLAYIIVAIIVGFNQVAMAEVGSLMPTTQATLRHLEHFIDPAWGFAYGYISLWAMIMPGEISAAAVIVSYWTDITQAAWISIIIVIVTGLNFLNIRYYGEIEFGFAMLKITLLTGLILSSIVITAGGGPTGEAIGFRYWRDPGPFVEYLGTGNIGKFAGFWKALGSAIFSFGGVQSVPALAGEVQYPRKTIFTACKRIFYRVSFLMIVTSFCLGLIVASNNPAIANSTGNAKSSPFVVAMEGAKIKVLPHIVNAGVLTSAFSAANQGIMGTTRLLFSLAVKGQAPKIFLRTNKHGVPWVGNIFVCAFLPLAYMNLSANSANVFNWFQSLTASNLLFIWTLISANHIFLTRAMKAQGIPRSRLPHSISFAPQAAWISGIASTILLLTGGFKNFVKGQFLFSSFFSSYFIFPLSFGLYFGYKIIMKTKIIKPHEVNLEVLFRDVENNPEPPDAPLKGWRILTLLWS